MLFIIASVEISAQVSFNVNAIEVDEPVTITVAINTAQNSCNGLSNPAKVYMHAGIGDKSNAFGFNVIGNWGLDDGVGEMTLNANGTYSITITPQTYFDLTAAQINTAARIGMVFRNADGTQELKLNQNGACGDFIFPIGAVQVKLTQPTSNLVVVNSGDNLTVRAVIDYQGSTTIRGTIEVFYNNTSIATSTCGTPACVATITNITESGEVRIVGTPPNGVTETNEAKFNVIVVPTVVTETMPAEMQDGINYIANDFTKAVLVLAAPGKDFVQVAGSFNNYMPTEAHTMKKDPSSDKFWLEISSLTANKIETYQYWVFDQSPATNSPNLVKTADPFSTLVLSPFDDPGIPETTYPNMPTYPEGQEREVTVLQTGQTTYNWMVTNFEKPKKEDLIVYEVLIRDFDANRNYQDLIDKIDYFKNLNINAIHLMPVMEFEGNESWGYNTSFHMALDKFYGTEDKLKEFIDTCHQNGIAVILDVVLNHAFGRNPLVRMWMNDPDNDGWGGDSNNSSAPIISNDSPYFNISARHSYNVGEDLNHQNSLTQEYTRRVLKHWIEDFKIDGFRWDLTKGFTQNCSGGDEGCTNSYQQDRVDLLKQYADYSWSLDTDHYVIFEHLGSDNEEQQWANHRENEGKGIMMWGKMTDEYNELTMANSGNKNFNRMGHKSRGFAKPRLMGYAESHDEERLMYKNIAFGNNSRASHNVRDLNTALSRMSALGAVTLTIPGPKMIWHFGDLGMDTSIFTCASDGSYDNDGCKLDTKAQPQWANNWLTTANRKKIYNDWSRINALKINEAVFEGDYNISSGSLTPRIDIFNTSIPETELRNVIVLANFDVVAQTVNTNFPIEGAWVDLMDASNSTTYSANTITLQPGEFKIFGNQSATLSTDAVALIRDILKVYPNPTSSAFSLSKDVLAVSVYDVTGKQVKEFTKNIIKNSNYSAISGRNGFLLKAS
ncbi:alpha-amylase family glycosyl hydrolase [Polaribacter sp. IC063]|nr:alpha-amylase family glycosyl hydrolase [Polaribacter sp. IC063]